MNQLSLALDLRTSVQQLTKPSGYKGLYGFHRYWGKKPAETVSFLVEQLSEPGEVVFDPFLGSGAIAREASMRGRRVIASDLNPAADDCDCAQWESLIEPLEGWSVGVSGSALSGSQYLVVTGDEGIPNEPRSVFLLVRRFADLKRTSEDLAAYSSILRHRSPNSAPEVIQGIWIDEEGVANLPSALALPDAGGGCRTVRILETTGINGIWMLCWLEAAARTVSRVDLVAALLECLGHEGTETATLAARFIPVFTGDTAEPSAREELRALEVRYPGLVLSPAFLDGNGALRLPPAQPHDGGTQS